MCKWSCARERKCGCCINHNIHHSQSQFFPFLSFSFFPFSRSFFPLSLPFPVPFPSLFFTFFFYFFMPCLMLLSNLYIFLSEIFLQQYAYCDSFRCVTVNGASSDNARHDRGIPAAAPRYPWH